MPWVAVWSGMGLATVGASLTFATARANVSVTLAPDGSVAVTVTETVPTSMLVGVPVKVRVVGLKVSQLGRAPVV
nr:hypothetical protein [Mycolicibacterium aurum]